MRSEHFVGLLIYSRKPLTCSRRLLHAFHTVNVNGKLASKNDPLKKYIDRQHASSYRASRISLRLHTVCSFVFLEGHDVVTWQACPEPDRLPTVTVTAAVRMMRCM